MLRIAVALGLIATLTGSARADATLDALVQPVPACDPARTHCIGLALHVPIVDARPIATATWIAEQVATANRHFERLGVGYQIVSIGPLKASAARVEDRKERSALGARVAGKVIDVFVTGHLDDIDTPGAMAWGVTWRRGSTKFIILSTQAWGTTLAHELGHVFGLRHSSYAISIMNKTKRDEPPYDQRTFADEEYAAMTKRLASLLRSRAIVPVKRAATARP